MTIMEHDGKFFIVRGPYLSQYFCFFVDSDSSSWSKKIFMARRYNTEEEAKRDYFELKQRIRAKQVKP